MKIKTIDDVVKYLDNFYYLADYEKGQVPPITDRNGKPFQEFSAVADERIIKNPEKVLAKIMISYIMKLIDHEDWCRMQEKKDWTQWVIEWRVRPEYEPPSAISNAAFVYARFSIYPRVKS